MCRYVDDQFAQYFEGESGMNRRNMVRLCLHFYHLLYLLYLLYLYRCYLNQCLENLFLNQVDCRVHCCLYFISPYGHGLKPLDLEFLRRLQYKVTQTNS